jgi:hypothetical protein
MFGVGATVAVGAGVGSEVQAVAIRTSSAKAELISVRMVPGIESNIGNSVDSSSGVKVPVPRARNILVYVSANYITILGESYE